MTPGQPPIRTRQLRVAVETGTLLHGIDLTVTDGETVALLGANGSGKSTLVKALVGIMPVTSGATELYGANVTAFRRSVPWARIGYVPQRLGPGSGVPATAVEVVASGLLDDRRFGPATLPAGKPWTRWSRSGCWTARMRVSRCSPAASSSAC